MTDQPLAGKTIAILVASGFEEVHMTEPQRALLAAGAIVRLVSPDSGVVNGWHGQAWGHYFPVDVPLSSALAADFDALLMPGGQRSVDKLASSAHGQRFLRGFADGSKPIVALGAAVSLLAGAERIKGRTVAANEDLRAAIADAGGTVADESLAIDNGLLTATSDVDMETLKETVFKHIVAATTDVAAAA